MEKRVKDEQGQGLVEFAIICSVLLIVFGTIVDGVNLIQHKMDLNSAATEMTTSITLDDLSVSGRAEAVCDSVLADNYSYLDDGMTTVACTVGRVQTDDLSSFYDKRYLYHNKELLGESPEVNLRNYSMVEVNLSRKVEMLSPVGRIVFGEKKELSSYRAARIYFN